MRTTAQVATEHQETVALIQRCKANYGRYPDLRFLFHVPNEGKRSYAAARRLKAEGMQSGVPDLWLPVARAGFSSLAIEMKRTKGGTVSEAQKGWIEALPSAGVCVRVARGQDEAWGVLEWYLSELPTRLVAQEREQ